MHKLKLFESRVQRQLFGPKRDGVTGAENRLHTEEINDLYCSSNIIRFTKSRKEMGGSCSTYGREERCTQGFLWRDLREEDHLEDLGVDGRITLK